MVHIIFRHYREGDEKQLADLFNHAFKRSVVIRSPTGWHWRYVKSPGFEPEMCQIAEDIDKKKIVGTILVNLVETRTIAKKKYLIGDINDVSTHPDYTKRGIATKLMENSIKFMKEKGCDFSMLSTGLRGFARSRIYQKFGYFDIVKEYYFVQIPNVIQLIRNFFGFVFFFPILFTISYLPRLLIRLRIKFKNFLKDFSYEINHNKKHFEYMNAINRISSKNYEGYPGYDQSKFNWARINVPANHNKPTYIVIKKGGKIVGGAVITHQNIYSFKFGIKIKFGIIHEIFIDEDKFNKKRDVHLAYVYLIDRIMKAATHRSISLLLYISSIKDYTLNKAFKGMNFLRFKSDVVMLKVLKENLKIPQIKKPLFLPTYL
ncbi:MAG: GNAT family N-acetyltransferase, partial [Candidatus Lokiarchaeota archaeon]|nr:GNAT family N-acetyltransferase [Candidatus Lokiarchaeota archaeon]